MTAVAQAAGCLGIRANDINSARVLDTDGDCVRVQVQYAHGKVLDHTFDAKDWAKHDPAPAPVRVPDPAPLPPRRTATAAKKAAPRKKAAKKRKSK